MGHYSAEDILVNYGLGITRAKGNQGDKSQYGSRLYGFGDSIGSPHNGGQIQLCVAFEQNMVLALTLSLLASSTLFDGINPR